MPMHLSLNKNTLLSMLLAGVVVLILVRIAPVTMDPVVTLVVSENRVDISNIYQPRDIEFTREVAVDHLNLFDHGRFRHPKIGDIAAGRDNFFIDVDHKIMVKRSGEYHFFIGSDDGFTLGIDGDVLCEFQGDRPYAIQSCPIFLNEGEHQVNLSYFQGHGPSGFTVAYAFGDGKRRWFGEASDALGF